MRIKQVQAEQVVLEVRAENNTRYNKHRGCVVVKHKLLRKILISETFNVINAAKRQTPKKIENTGNVFPQKGHAR